MKYNNIYYNNLKKSSLTPPSWIFGPVWSILYTSILISSYLIWNNSKCKKWCYALTLFFIQLLFNLLWTTIFFKFQNIKLALLDLFLLIIFLILTILEFFKISKISAFILVPYLFWCFFALYLNIYIFINN